VNTITRDRDDSLDKEFISLTGEEGISGLGATDTRQEQLPLVKQSLVFGVLHKSPPEAAPLQQDIPPQFLQTTH